MQDERLICGCIVAARSPHIVEVALTPNSGPLTAAGVVTMSIEGLIPVYGKWIKITAVAFGYSPQPIRRSLI